MSTEKGAENASGGIVQGDPGEYVWEENAWVRVWTAGEALRDGKRKHLGRQKSSNGACDRKPSSNAANEANGELSDVCVLVRGKRRDRERRTKSY